VITAALRGLARLAAILLVPLSAAAAVCAER